VKKILFILMALMLVIGLVGPGAMAYAEEGVGSATISTDKTDYEPGDTVLFSGSGFQPGEAVDLIAVGSTNGTPLESNVNADENGDISGTLALPFMYEQTYTLTATGTVSGPAQVTFGDDVTSLTVQTPSNPATVQPGDTQEYVALAKTTKGDGIEGVTITWSVEGGSSVGSMSPLTSVTDSNGNASSTLTVSPTASAGSDWVIAIAYGAGQNGKDKDTKQRFYIGTGTVPTEVSITITSSPVTGPGFVKVDNVAYATPHVFSWVPDSTHSLEALSPVAGAAGTQYVWTDWSDDGDQTHDYFVPGIDETVTANYKTQYLVSFEQTGSAVAPTVDYTANTDPTGTVPFDVWVKADTEISYTYQAIVDGDPGVRYVLTDVDPASPQTVTGPLTITGTYKTQYYLTLVTSPAGLTTPSGEGWYDANTSAAISTTNPVGSYYFAGWTTGDQAEIAAQYSLSTTVLMDKAKTVTANYRLKISATGGNSMGFWSNKNGQALLTLGWAGSLNGLAPYATFTPYPKEPASSTPFKTLNLATFKSQVSGYLLNANATDMRYMLAAQLLATELNVLKGPLSASQQVWVDDGDLIVEPGEVMTIGNIMANAITQWSSGTRATQEYYKNLLDKINNNQLWFLAP